MSKRLHSVSSDNIRWWQDPCPPDI